MTGHDLVCIGRSCVDLYAEQRGSPLEDVESLRMYVGGSSANIAVGTARLGLDVALLTRVGDEQLGRFLTRSLARNGVDVGPVRVDPQRLTPMVLLAVRELDSFPRIFHYADPADLALEPADIDPALIASARALLVGGSCLSRPTPRAAAHAAVAAARAAGTIVIVDIDFRPVLWGLEGHAEGAQAASLASEVTAAYAELLGACHLVVGTTEELAVAGGSADIGAALRAIRDHTSALIIHKDGARGATLYTGAIPDDLEDGLRGPAFKVEALNTVGAGDAFLAGFLLGWLRGDRLERALELANACGAIVVSRHGCSPAMPTEAELTYFLEHADTLSRPGDDDWLNHLHRATTRGPASSPLVLAVDHRWQLERMADDAGVDRTRIVELKDHFAAAFLEVALDTPEAGILLDDRYGLRALERVTGSGRWVGRAIEVAGSRPVELSGGDNVGLELLSWPSEHIVKVMVLCRPDDADVTWAAQDRVLRQLAAACALRDREMLVELQSPDGSGFAFGEVVTIMEHIYDLAVRPDWWKLPPVAEAKEWGAAGDLIRARDPYCRGMLVLGQGADPDVLAASFAAAAAEPLCRGFAVGRSIFAEPAAAWFAGDLDDEGLVAAVVANYRAVLERWVHGAA